MPEKIHYVYISMPKEKPATCDQCPLLGTLPKIMTKANSKYVRVCCHAESFEYISNRGSHQKRGRYCPFDKSPQPTDNHTSFDTYKEKFSGKTYAITQPCAEAFGLYTPPKQLKLKM